MIGGAKGIGIGLDFGIGNQARPNSGKYLDPTVKEALCGIWIADQNTNESPTRNIIKNKIPNRGGDFEILNAAYKLNSGYGKYNVDFTTWSKAPNNKLEYKDYYIKVKAVDDFNPYGYVIWRTTAINSFKVRIKGLQKDTILRYTYWNDAGQHIIYIKDDGIYELPSSIDNTSVGFGFSIVDQPRELFIGLTITQIPEYQGAFVTDGVDDMIVSQKSVSDMLGENKDFTIISMMHQISKAETYAYTNYIRNTDSYSRNIIRDVGKTGIYGYYYELSTNRLFPIIDILGDKADYSLNKTETLDYNVKFSVEGYIDNYGLIFHASEVAWYWTLIAKRVLTTDEINQVIAYYNLDKYVVTDVYYNVKKQGLTNENHADFGDKLIDYSGNGKDMQLYNIGWEGMSGINGYPVVLGKDKTWKEASTKQGVFTHNSIHITEQNNSQAILFTYIINGGVYIEENNKEIPAFNVRVTGITDKYTLYYRYIKEDGEVNSGYSIKTDGVYTFPKSHLLGNTTGTSVWIGFHVAKNNPDITNPSDIFIEILPEYEGALVTDGIEDYGKVEGLPIYKDYTVIAERAWIEPANNNGSLISKSAFGGNGAFIIEQSFNPGSGTLATYSFGVASGAPANNVNEKSIVAQSKYKYISDKSYDLVAGSDIDTDSITLATVREGDPRFSKLAFWTLLYFPYSLSEFLIERQLKKRKLGTLYPDMIEFRPIVKSNIPYSYITFYAEDWSRRIYPGEYIAKDYTIKANLYLNNDLQELSKATCNGKEINFNRSASVSNAYNLSISAVDKTPQKIDLMIDDYIRFEDIVQPYPMFFEFIDENGNLFSWGGKARIGSTITRTKGVSYANILPDMYDITAPKLNGVPLSTLDHTVNKDMVFSCIPVWKLGNNPPKVLLSPERLRLSNETYKLLGYIPDLSGNGNHGVFNNFAYTEKSGVTADNSIKFDAADDVVTIPTLKVGGDQVLIKAKWSIKLTFLYDQRLNTVPFNFALYCSEADNPIAYNSRNNGFTYINGVLNNDIKTYSLIDLVHTVTVVNDGAANGNGATPFIGTSRFGYGWSDLSLYTFMLFDKIDDADTIMKLNEVIGIEEIYRV